MSRKFYVFISSKQLTIGDHDNGQRSPWSAHPRIWNVRRGGSLLTDTHTRNLLLDLCIYKQRVTAGRIFKGGEQNRKRQVWKSSFPFRGRSFLGVCTTACTYASCTCGMFFFPHKVLKCRWPQAPVVRIFSFSQLSRFIFVLEIYQNYSFVLCQVSG